MKREKKLGAYFGITGGIIALILVASLFEMSTQYLLQHIPESLTLILPCLGFSALFGSQAGHQIKNKGHNGFVAQFFSGIFTIVCTIPVHAILVSMLFWDINYLGIIPMALVVAILAGIIPMIILSLLFGLILRSLLKTKS